MIKKLLLCSMILFAAIQLIAVEKSDFDISMSEDRCALQKSTGAMYTGKMLQRQISEMTLIQGGYFTIGTNEGHSGMPIDDHCGITFGHPFALTSYPLIAVDGQWRKPVDEREFGNAAFSHEFDSILEAQIADGLDPQVLSAPGAHTEPPEYEVILRIE